MSHVCGIDKIYAEQLQEYLAQINNVGWALTNSLTVHCH